MGKLKSLLAGMASTLAIIAAHAAEPLRVFDGHLHYNIESRDAYPSAAVLPERRLAGVSASSSREPRKT